MLNLLDIGKVIQTLRSQLPQVAFSWPAAIFALLSVESSMGIHTTPNYAASFGPGGHYFDDIQKDLYSKYGQIASSALGPFQILYRVAWDHGFRGTPSELATWSNQVKYFGKIIENRFTNNQGSTLEHLARTWNGGNPKGSVEGNYLEKFNKAYQIGLEKMKGMESDLSGAASKLGVAFETIAIAALIVVAAKLLDNILEGEE